MNELTNNQEKLIKSLYTRHGRKKHNMCVCEGIRCCMELAAASPALIHLVVKSDNTSLPDNLARLQAVEIPYQQMKKLSCTIASQGIIIVAHKPDILKEQTTDDPFAVILDGISDPGNMGTIIRTVKAVGLKHLWLTEGSADPFGEKVIRSAMAGQFHLNLRMFGNLKEALCESRRMGFMKIYRTDCHRGISIFETEDLFAKSAIIFGGEATGASPAAGSIPVTIPMPGKSESINVAQAATVTLFEAVRRKVL